MTFSLRMNEKDSNLVKKYAEMNGISVSDLLRQTVLERIEDEYDLKCYYEALAEYEANPVTYTLEEVANELGIKL